MKFLFYDMRSYLVDQAGLELLGSSDLSASCRAGTTDMCQRSQLFFKCRVDFVDNFNNELVLNLVVIYISTRSI
jgi:hypothetical protein